MIAHTGVEAWRSKRHCAVHCRLITASLLQRAIRRQLPSPHRIPPPEARGPCRRYPGTCHSHYPRVTNLQAKLDIVVIFGMILLESILSQTLSNMRL